MEVILVQTTRISSRLFSMPARGGDARLPLKPFREVRRREWSRPPDGTRSERGLGRAASGRSTRTRCIRPFDSDALHRAVRLGRAASGRSTQTRCIRPFDSDALHQAVLHRLVRETRGFRMSMRPARSRRLMMCCPCAQRCPRTPGPGLAGRSGRSTRSPGGCRRSRAPL
jgi:hypothetical protein